MVCIDEVIAYGLTLPRSTEGVVRGRRKLYIGRIVYVAHETDGIFGFAHPKEWREALVPYLQVFRATSGQVLQDALCPLNKRLHVTLVGSTGATGAVPAQWEGEIRRRAPHIVIDRMAAKTTEDLQRIVNGRIAHGDRYGVRDEEGPPV